MGPSAGFPLETTTSGQGDGGTSKDNVFCTLEGLWSRRDFQVLGTSVTTWGLRWVPRRASWPGWQCQCLAGLWRLTVP